MSEITELQEDLETTATNEELLAEAKSKATLLGITYSPNIGLDTLLERIAEKTKEPEVEEKSAEEQELEATAEETVVRINPKVAARNRATRLVRVAITCQDENRKQLTGEYFTFRNSVVGKVTKFIPYNCEAADSYMVPYCLVNMLRKKKTQYFTKREVNGVQVPTPQMKPAFIITELPPLTQDEIDAIAKRQATRASI